MIVYYCKNLIQIGGAELLLSYEIRSLLKYQKEVRLYCKNYDSRILVELGLEDVLTDRAQFLRLLFQKSSHIFFVGGLGTMAVLSLLGRKNLYYCDHHPIVCKPLNTERRYLDHRLDADRNLGPWNKFNRHFEYKTLLNGLWVSGFIRHVINTVVYRNCTSIVLSDLAVYEKKLLYQATSIKLIPTKFSIGGISSRKAPLILIIGRLEESKRIGLLLQAFLKSNLVDDGYTCRVLGTGSLEQQLKADYADHNNIVFMGYVSNSLKSKYLHEASAVLNGQVADFNLVDIEARCNRCAYITPGLRNDFKALTYLPDDEAFLVNLINKHEESVTELNETDLRIRYLLERCS